ncbi:MAG: hypothetical protein AVDCRST_MAG02-2361 [uncultured Rubrobacteraceae bacterium]|uniref:Uncharacterized protein n=1 Tax=uncultured Rubrobacteraceae bacterium TaxID=349277 RepID=A0A6J4QVS8_9ACTN|nr:MAG: hypothetical protein AVDCRST_MAG02-2361 [uncultured Rubrobacteraceae bacterium]
MTSELWQFAILIGAFLVIALLWLFIIYLPGRTMEYSRARRMETRDSDPGTTGDSD